METAYVPVNGFVYREVPSVPCLPLNLSLSIRFPIHPSPRVFSVHRHFSALSLLNPTMAATL